MSQLHAALWTAAWVAAAAGAAPCTPAATTPGPDDLDLLGEETR